MRRAYRLQDIPDPVHALAGEPRSPGYTNDGALNLIVGQPQLVLRTDPVSLGPGWPRWRRKRRAIRLWGSRHSRR
jgi:hypothetical protein